MRGLVPRIHVFAESNEDVDGRDKPGHDDDYVFSMQCHAILPTLRRCDADCALIGTPRPIIHAISLRAGVRRLDDRPPFLDLGLLQRRKRIGRLLMGREELFAEVAEA
jgi:hypothetical protein